MSLLYFREPPPPGPHHPCNGRKCAACFGPLLHSRGKHFRFVFPPLNVIEHAHEDDPLGKRHRDVLCVPLSPESFKDHLNLVQKLFGGVVRIHLPLDIDRNVQQS